MTGPILKKTNGGFLFTFTVPNHSTYFGLSMGKHKKMAAKVILENHDPAKILKNLKVAPSIPLSPLLDPRSLVHVFYTNLFERSALGL